MLVQKKILPSNIYKVNSSQGRIPKKFTPSYLQKIAETSNKMIEAGLKIPAPFDHNKDAKPRTKEEIQKLETEIALNKSSSSYHNAGYWTTFWVAPDENGRPALWGQADIAGDISDTNSPAFKALNTAKEVSISLADKYEDGLARTWSDGLLHVALVNQPVVPDQSDFEESITIVNMSMLEDEGGATNEGDTKCVEELKTSLRKIKINLPESTTVKTFLRDLLVAVSQIGDNDTDKLEPAPIYMSIGDEDMKLSQVQAEALVKSGTVNPATSKPFTMEDLGFTQKAPVDMSNINAQLAEKDNAIAGLKGMLKAFMNKYNQEKQVSLQKRISDLVGRGLSKDYADTNLTPKVAIEMSVLSDGTFSEHPLEITLSALEATIPAKKSATQQPGGFPLDGNIMDNDNLGGASDLTDEQMNAALKAFAADGIL